MKRYCPWCGNTFDGPVCPCRPKRKRKPTGGDSTRAEREPWRKEYWSEEYRKARQKAISRTGGRCTDCGRQCAEWDGRRWLTAGLGGEVDHVKALSEGGTNDAANLQLRCKSCHARRDASRRRGEEPGR